MVFFVLNKKIFNPETEAETFFFPSKSPKVGEAPKCPACKRYISLMSWLPPYEVNLECRGKKFGDLVYGSGLDLLVSASFRASYFKWGLKGFDGFNLVQICKIKRGKKNKSLPPEYFQVKPAYCQTAIEPITSGVELPPDCEVCLSSPALKRIEKVSIDQTTWDGTDVFFPRGLPGIIVVTERFRDLCLKNSFSNVAFISAEEYQIDFYPWEKSSSANR